MKQFNHPLSFNPAQASREYPSENLDIFEKLSAPTFVSSDRGCLDNGALNLGGKMERPSLEEQLIVDPYYRSLILGRGRDGDFDLDSAYEGVRKRAPDTVKSSASLRYAGLGKRSLKVKF